MTTSKLVETCNVEALDPTEAKAAFLSLYKQQRHWIEITDDSATWPPIGEIVWAVNEYREVAVLMFDGFEHGRMLWRKATKMKLGHHPNEDKIVFKYSITADHGPITHWRPI